MDSRNYIFLIFISVAAVAVAVLLGNGLMNPFSLTEQDRIILFELRIPRVLCAFFVGGILSVCGAMYQSIFQTPLASPFTLGVTSGASVGALAGQILMPQALSSAFIGGAAGAILATIFIDRVSKILDQDTATQLLLMGLIVSLFCGSLIVLLQYISNSRELFQMTRWLMGSLEVVRYEIPIIVTIASVILFFIALKYVDELNLISIGHLFAETKGVDVSVIIRRIFILSSVAIGIVVSYCGPIGFVGVAVPFLARAYGGYYFQQQIPVSFILGGIFLTLCDVLSRVLFAPAEIPVGVITALIGAPIFAIVLIKKV